jgi:hypothetical protein
MGIDREYQALPPDWPVLAMARSGVCYHERLQFTAFLLERGCVPIRQVLTGEEVAFCSELEALVRANPGIETRNFYLGRWWDILHFLLSSLRRDGRSSGDDLGTKAVCGAQSMPKHLVAGQGIPLRWSEPIDVLDIAIFLDTMTETGLREHYRPEEIDAANVYKWPGSRANEEDWLHIIRFFEGLRRFYIAAAEHDEGVLVVAD